MTSTEPIQAGPYPEPSDPPDGPNQMAAIVTWAATRSVMRFASVAARDAAITSPVEGMVAVTGTGPGQQEWRYVAGDWLNVTTGPWQQYTPTLTGSTTDPILGSGATAWGRWRYLGGQVVGSLVIAFGESGVSPGSGFLTVGLPAARSAAYGGGAVLGTMFLTDASSGAEFVRDLRVTGVMGRGGGLVTSESPIPWGPGDHIAGTFSYEPA